MNELVSIIVPVYNSEKYIDNCVQSILSQTYDNFELLLINDGSTDSSLSNCKKWESVDSRIKVIDKENGGASSARNVGLSECRGEYVVFVDSDDYVAKTYVSNLMLAVKEGPFDIVQCSLQQVSDFGSIASVSFSKDHIREITKQQALNDRLYKVSVCGKIYRRTLFDNFSFKEGSVYEDDASYYIFVDRAERIAILDEILYYYYMSDDSVMRNNDENRSLAFIEIYEERIEYFKSRENIPLLEGTYGRFCLVLLLSYSLFKKKHTNKSDINTMYSLFLKYYKCAIRSKFVSLFDKVLFRSFRFFPNITAKIIGIIRYR